MWIGFLLSGLIGLVIGYFISRALKNKGQTNLENSLKMLTDLLSELIRQQGAVSSSLSSVGNLSALVSELKVRYEEMKRAEEELSYQRERRLEEFMSSMRKSLEEVSNKTLKIDEEKEKRISELVEHMKRFSDEQRASIERFLMQQGQSREEIEKRRDAELKDMRRIIEEFVRTVSGTKTRGQVGEMLLSEALSESIKVGTVVKDLRIGSMIVEFAWHLGDGKYIPIDSKLPDLSDLIEEFDEAQEDREEKKREIIQKIQREIENVKKYQNQSNTIDCCIMVVPSAVIEMAPELVSYGKRQNVFLCTHKELFAIAHYLEARYVTTRQDEAAKYRHLVQTLLSIFEQIEQRSNSLERATKQVINANNEIKNLIVQARMSTGSTSNQQQENN
ncbi:MAG: DNA recombination protein RmuC [Pseudothermotoga sp.]